MKTFLQFSLGLLSAIAPAFAGPALLVTTNTALYNVDSTGVATVFSTYDGSNNPFSFAQARGLALGPDGNYYVADLGNGSDGGIYRVNSSTGVVSSFAELNRAYGLAWSGGTLYASTFASAGTVTSFDLSGNSILSVGTGYSNLSAILVGSDDDLFVSSGGAHGVLHITNLSGAGPGVSIFADTQPHGAYANGPISTPRGITFVGQTLYIADSASCTGACIQGGNDVAAYDPSTPSMYAFSTSLASGGNPQGLLYDSASNSLYFARNTGGAISAISLTDSTVTNYASITGAHDLIVLSAQPSPSLAQRFSASQPLQLSLSVCGSAARKRPFRTIVVPKKRPAT